MRRTLSATLPPVVRALLKSPVKVNLLNEAICLAPEELSQLDLARWKQLYKVILLTFETYTL